MLYITHGLLSVYYTIVMWGKSVRWLKSIFMYLSQTFWVSGFKLFHIVPMSYHSFRNKWKTLRLIICIKLLVQTILVQRHYIKTIMKILCTKITAIARLVDVNIIWVLGFGP